MKITRVINAEPTRSGKQELSGHRCICQKL